jgi:hypothetical protein
MQIMEKQPLPLEQMFEERAIGGNMGQGGANIQGDNMDAFLNQHEK